MSYSFHCQLDYAHIPYPSEAHPNSNMKDAACGPCSCSMIVENLTESKLPPIEAVKIALDCKARDNYGTDMTILGPVVAKMFDLDYKESSDVQALLDCLDDGGMVIANAGNNYEGHVGVFTRGGHYIVVAKREGARMCILDPDLHDGKFDIPGRKGKISVTGNEAWCDLSTLILDCANRQPAYYLFNTKK